MSGMDRLTDAELHPLTMIDGSVGAMARELLAHRRASQAAPVPVAWMVEDLHSLSYKSPFATNVRKHVEGIYSDPTEFRVTPLYAAPAPSDGLREAVETIVNTHGFLTDLGYILGKQNGNYRRAWASAVVRREMIKLAQQYADGVLSASPAQEGDRQ